MEKKIDETTIYIFGSIFTASEIAEIYEKISVNPRVKGVINSEKLGEEIPFYTVFEENGFVVFPYSKDPSAIVIGKPIGEAYRTVRLTFRNFVNIN